MRSSATTSTSRCSTTRPPAGKSAKVKTWFRVYNAWPTSVSFSDLDAGANAIIVNQMTLAHEGFDVAVASNCNDDIKSWKARNTRTTDPPQSADKGTALVAVPLFLYPYSDKDS